MFLLAIRNGYEKYKYTVLKSDGATWIRNMHDLIFADAHQILDYCYPRDYITGYYKIIIIKISIQKNQNYYLLTLWWQYYRSSIYIEKNIAIYK
jgi:hypothetical protein